MQYAILVVAVLVIVAVVIVKRMNSGKTAEIPPESPGSTNIPTREQHLEGEWAELNAESGVATGVKYDIHFSQEGMNVGINGLEFAKNASYASTSTTIVEMYTVDGEGLNIVTQFSIIGPNDVVLRQIPDPGTSPVMLKRVNV